MRPKSRDFDELKFSREQGFFDKSGLVRFFIALLFFLSLFAILHFRQVKVEVLELGTVAPRYIVAQVDVDFPDDEATLILKSKAASDVGKVYQVSDAQIRHRRQEFENFLVSDLSWQTQAPGSSFEEMYAGVDEMDKILSKIRFTDSRTDKFRDEMGFKGEHDEVFVPKTPSGKLPEKVWDDIEDELPVSAKGAEIITKFFKGLSWDFVEDIPAEQKLRAKVQEAIPETISHVSAGSRIIDQGEKVTARHVNILQAVKEKVGEARNLFGIASLLGSLILTGMLTLISVVYFHINYPEILRSNRRLFLVVTISLMTFALAKGGEYFFLSSKNTMIEFFHFPLFVPFAAILLASLVNSSVATFCAAFLTIVLAIVLAFDRNGFLLMNLTASLVAIMMARELRHRKDIFLVCMKAWVATLFVLLSFHLYHDIWTSYFTDASSSFVFLLLSAIVVVGLLPFFESAFKIMTDVQLMEYMDPSHDLLRRLSIEAPGTYQHSVVVGNLAEAAALAIDANGLFCRAASLYHDIGKMVTPQYFTENQHGGMNIHKLLTPQESAEVIINHVTEGVVMARKAGLPEQFIDIIKEHHGTTLVYFFYRRELEKMDRDKSLVDERQFRYAGPKPRTRESAIIMVADSLEAASRSVDPCDEESLQKLAEQIIREKAEDGQFDDCLITFEEMAQVVRTLAKTLAASCHARIRYPKRGAEEKEMVEI